MNFAEDQLNREEIVKLSKISVEELKLLEEEVVNLRQENATLKYWLEFKSGVHTRVEYPCLINAEASEGTTHSVEETRSTGCDLIEEIDEGPQPSDESPLILEESEVEGYSACDVKPLEETETRSFEGDSANSTCDAKSWADTVSEDGFSQVIGKKKVTVPKKPQKIKKKLNSFVKYDDLIREMEGMKEYEKKSYIRQEYQKVLDYNGYVGNSEVIYVGFNSRCKIPYHYVIFEIEFDPDDNLLREIQEESDWAKRRGAKYGQYHEMYGLMDRETAYIRFAEHIES